MRLLLLALLFCSASAFADVTFKQTLNTAVTYNGKPAFDGSITYHGMSAQALAYTRTHAARVAAVMSHLQNKGGEYSITLLETVVDSSGVKTTSDPLVYEGVTLAGYNNLMRAQYKAGDTMLKASEKFVADSKKTGMKSRSRASLGNESSVPWAQ